MRKCDRQFNLGMGEVRFLEVADQFSQLRCHIFEKSPKDLHSIFSVSSLRYDALESETMSYLNGGGCIVSAIHLNKHRCVNCSQVVFRQVVHSSKGWCLVGATYRKVKLCIKTEQNCKEGPLLSSEHVVVRFKSESSSLHGAALAANLKVTTLIILRIWSFTSHSTPLWFCVFTGQAAVMRE